MSQPPVPYDRIFNFETFSTTNPTVQQPGVQIDGELDAVKVTLDSLISRLSEVQRSDGKLNPSAFETTGIPESIASQAYTIVYAQLQPLVLTSAQSASEASASAATAGNHANAAASSASSANAAIAPAVAAKDQAVLKAAEAQASAVSANASASTSASAKVESESYRDQALVARDEANQALSSINILKGNIDNRYGDLLDSSQNLADVSSKSQSVTNLGLDATDPSHRGLYNRVCSLVHMYVDPKTNEFATPSLHSSADSFLEAQFGLVFNHNTGLFSASQFGGAALPIGGFPYYRPNEVTTISASLEERVDVLKNRLSVMGWIFQSTILSQTSNFLWSNAGDNRILTLYDYGTDPGNAISAHTWSHVQGTVNTVISNHYTSNDVPMDNKQYVRKNRTWLELPEVGGGGGSGISDYDNSKVYNAEEIVHLSGVLYRFNAFIGSAGYGPVTNPEAWTKLTVSVISDISGLQTALDGKAQLSGAAFTGKISGTSVSGNAGVNIGIGGTSVDATTPGDLWIPASGTTLNYRDATGSWRQVLTTSQIGVIDTSATNPALRITQRGTGEALRVEDSNNPDSTPFVVDNNGNVAIGASGTNGYKLYVVGGAYAQTLVSSFVSTNGISTSNITLAGDPITNAIGNFIFSGQTCATVSQQGKASVVFSDPNTSTQYYSGGTDYNGNEIPEMIVSSTQISIHYDISGNAFVQTPGDTSYVPYGQTLGSFYTDGPGYVDVQSDGAGGLIYNYNYT